MSYRGSATDQDALNLFLFRLYSNLQGAVTAALVHLGDRLGLFRALADADEPLSSADLAVRTGLDERWVREWAYQQGAAELVVVDPETERISLTQEAVAVLADEAHEAFGLGEFDHLPSYFSDFDDVERSFRTGVGHNFDHAGVESTIGLERAFEPWNRHHLVPDVLPALDGVTDRLTAGVRAADVGCGAGGAVLLMAAAFPASSFTGYDISQLALARANERLASAGLDNASFADPRTDPLPDDGSLGFVTMFDCLHDMSHPQEMANAVCKSLADDGTWLLCDIKALDTYAQNVTKNPMAALMYGFSVLSCMSSGLSEPGGAGLGTLGMSETKVREIAATAGFSQVRRLSIEHPTNAFYEIRP